MTEICFIGEDRFLNQLKELQEDLPFRLSEQGIPFVALADKEYKIQTSKNGEKEIHYTTTGEFFSGFLLTLASLQNNNEIKPTFFCKERGLMLDCSRNAVATKSTVKKLIRILALLGYTYLELYTEDTYEIDGEPYFGYQRGRYSQEEIKELDDYAYSYGIELIPCIQTLAHLKTIFRWQCYSDIWDIDDTLLVGADKTYRFIEKMFKGLRSCVRSKKIHIGLDEAHHLGRGLYCDLNGYKKKGEVYLQHLKNVAELCQKYDFAPYFWGDMVFADDMRDTILRELPSDARFIYWEYERSDENSYEEKLSQISKYCQHIVFAGGAWKWFGFAPHNRLTEKNMASAVAVCKRYGVEDMLLTAWGDNGAECSIFSVLPAITRFIGHCFCTGKADFAQSVIPLFTGYSLEEMLCLDLPNCVNDNENFPVNPSKYLFYNDPFIGLLDTYDHIAFRQKFAETEEVLQKLSKKQSEFSYLFASLSALCSVLASKAGLGLEIVQAYKQKDTEKLKQCILTLEETERRTEVFYCLYKTQWKKENKTIGFEVHDIRFGGLIRRFQHCRELLTAFINGELQKIEELEEERLPYFIHRNNDVDVWHNSWQTMTTNNPL